LGQARIPGPQQKYKPLITFVISGFLIHDVEPRPLVPLHPELFLSVAFLSIA
jgi:hypothetical protein